MIRRVLLVLAAIAATAGADTATYLRSQAFGDGPPRSWRYYHPNQGFGFFPTNASGAGEAGGFFFPKGFTAYYADFFLNGALGRATPLSARGSIRLDEVSFDPGYSTSVYVGHFRKGSTDAMFVNIVGLALTGNDSSSILASPVVQFSNGRAFVGDSIKLPVNSAPASWSYQWTPGSGAFGFGTLTITIANQSSTLVLDNQSSGLDFALDAFGLYQPAFQSPNTASYFTFFIDNLKYSALQGPAPRISVKGPRKVVTSSSKVTFSGTTDAASVGNTIRTVRYRVVHNGRPGHYRTAKGTTRWTATFTVPPGGSTIEFQAIGDNGRRTDRSRTVVR